MRLLMFTNNRRGVSLVEVLAALVIFVVGILSVVRMFPGGFATVKHSENTTIASRLAQAELERWKNRSANLPSGIMPWGPLGTGLGTIPDVDPENLNTPFVDGDPKFSDVNKFRRIYREATIIPAPSSSNWGYGSVYVLGFSPIDYDPSDPKSVMVYSGSLRRRSLPRNLNSLTIKSLSQYAIDYDDHDRDSDAGVVYVASASYPRTYVISYSYWLNVSDRQRPELVTVLGQELYVPAGTGTEDYQEVRIPDPAANVNQGPPYLQDMSGFLGIDRRSESVHRGFTDLTGTNVPWDPNNPYQFRLENTAAGVMLFNPAGYGQQELTARGKEPLVANIDYTVLDWHIISEERQVDDRGKIKLSLRFLKQIGEDYGDSALYAGMSPVLPFSIMVVDMETGMVYGDDPAVFTPDFKEGILTFAANLPNGEPTRGRTFRVYYQADGDWAVQLFKAFEVYTRSPNRPPSATEYHLSGDGKAMFRRCYAGCTVAMDIKYRYTEQGGPEMVRTARGVSFEIPEQYATVGLAQVCEVDVLKGLQALHPAGTAIQIDDITSVYGVSVGAKVVWRETGRGFERGRWKQKSLQTYLTRGGI